MNGRNLSAIFKKSVAQGQTIPYIVAGSCAGSTPRLRHGLPRRTVSRSTSFTDVTLQNVIVSHDGQVKLVDFGIAKAAPRWRHCAMA